MSPPERSPTPIETIVGPFIAAGSRRLVFASRDGAGVVKVMRPKVFERTGEALYRLDEDRRRVVAELLGPTMVDESSRLATVEIGRPFQQKYLGAWNGRDIFTIPLYFSQRVDTTPPAAVQLQQSFLEASTCPRLLLCKAVDCLVLGLGSIQQGQLRRLLSFQGQGLSGLCDAINTSASLRSAVRDFVTTAVRLEIQCGEILDLIGPGNVFLCPGARRSRVVIVDGLYDSHRRHAFPSTFRMRQPSDLDASPHGSAILNYIILVNGLARLSGSEERIQRFWSWGRAGVRASGLKAVATCEGSLLESTVLNRR